MAIDSNLMDRLAVAALQRKLNEYKELVEKLQPVWDKLDFEIGNCSVTGGTYHDMSTLVDKLGDLNNG